MRTASSSSRLVGASRGEVIWPKLPSPYLLSGFWNWGVLVRLYTWARNSVFTRSVMLKFFVREVSQVRVPGPGKAFLGRVPTRPAGAVNAPAGQLNQTFQETPVLHPPW